MSASRPTPCAPGKRRYGTVDPRRTAGGSRPYVAAQIDRLRTLKQLTDSGHSIGEVARLSLAELKGLLADALEQTQEK
jgi:DNA-binding transcriptional MerR regulator